MTRSKKTVALLMAICLSVACIVVGLTACNSPYNPYENTRWRLVEAKADGVVVPGGEVFETTTGDEITARFSTERFVVYVGEESVSDTHYSYSDSEFTIGGEPVTVDGNKITYFQPPQNDDQLGETLTFEKIE